MMRERVADLTEVPKDEEIVDALVPLEKMEHPRMVGLEPKVYLYYYEHLPLHEKATPSYIIGYDINVWPGLARAGASKPRVNKVNHFSKPS